MNKSCRKTKSQAFHRDKENLNKLFATDSKIQKKESVGKVKVMKDGAEFIGEVCEQSERKENQDKAFWFFTKTGILCAGVCDGHGKLGKLVSETCSVLLEELISKKLENVKVLDFTVESTLTDVFKEVQTQLKKRCEHPKKNNLKWSGCTASIVLIDEERCVVANVGDSEAIKVTKKGKVEFKTLTRLHRASDEDEKKRIEATEGKVEGERIYFKDIKMPGLMVARSFGDFGAHERLGVICVPSVKTFTLTKEDIAVVVASDGVWDFIDKKSAIEVVDSCSNALEASQKLVKASLTNQNSKQCDNTTAVVVFLEDTLVRKVRVAVYSPRRSPEKVETTYGSENTTVEQKQNEQERYKICVIF